MGIKGDIDIGAGTEGGGDFDDGIDIGIGQELAIGGGLGCGICERLGTGDGPGGGLQIGWGVPAGNVGLWGDDGPSGEFVSGGNGRGRALQRCVFISFKVW